LLPQISSILRSAGTVTINLSEVHGYVDRTRLAVSPLPSGLLQQLLVLVLSDLLSAPLQY